MTCGYETDGERRRDLLQEIHVALWRSFLRFDGRCSLRTWVYRVAHNTATSVALRSRARAPQLVGLEEFEGQFEAKAAAAAAVDPERAIDDRRAIDRLLGLVASLKPLDRQVILLYLEGVEAAAIGEVTGLSATNVSTKVHRIKRLLARRVAGKEKGDE